MKMIKKNEIGINLEIFNKVAKMGVKTQVGYDKGLYKNGYAKPIEGMFVVLEKPKDIVINRSTMSMQERMKAILNRNNDLVKQREEKEEKELKIEMSEELIKDTYTRHTYEISDKDEKIEEYYEDELDDEEAELEEESLANTDIDYQEDEISIDTENIEVLGMQGDDEIILEDEWESNDKDNSRIEEFNEDEKEERIEEQECDKNIETEEEVEKEETEEIKVVEEEETEEEVEKEETEIVEEEAEEIEETDDVEEKEEIISKVKKKVVQEKNKIEEKQEIEKKEKVEGLKKEKDKVKRMEILEDSRDNSKVLYRKGMSLKEFLKFNPSIRQKEEVLKWFSKKEIELALSRDEVYIKKGKFIL